MLRLLLKIFFAYWAVAGVVIAISDFAPHRHVHHPELTDALDSAMAMNGRSIVEAYESGRCRQFQALLSGSGDALYLAAPDGRMLCGDNGLPEVARLVASAHKQNRRVTDSYARFQVLAAPAASRSGATYVLLLKSNYTSALQVYGLLPGLTTISISCAVTIVLGLLIAMPIRRLRQAAGEIALGRLDARVRWGRLAAEPAGSKQGDDIDQLIRDFNHMAERLQALVKAQRTLLRDISHELRSPLTRLGVALGIARAQAPANMREPLGRIESEATRLNVLIGQILSLSHVDVADRIDAPSRISLSELVLDLLPDIEYEAAQCDCLIDTNIGPSGYVNGDDDLLRAAIENIVRNAIKYAAAGKLIQLETSTEDRQGKRYSVVSVSDHGQGIPEAEIGFVREPFYRADQARRSDQEGTGLGLAIVNRAVLLHGGVLEICNRPEGGLVVCICLPLADELSAIREIRNQHPVLL